MSKVNSAPIKKQPVNQDVYNTFPVMGNEEVLYEYTQENKFCGCSDIYYTTLTDARVLIRIDTTTCCNQQDYTDSSLFLRDIAVIRLIRESRCCRKSKIMELRGIFGSKILRIPENDMNDLQMEISTRVGNHKLISHH
jgi:hypothetical protein